MKKPLFYATVFIAAAFSENANSYQQPGYADVYDNGNGSSTLNCWQSPSECYHTHLGADRVPVKGDHIEVLIGGVYYEYEVLSSKKESPANNIQVLPIDDAPLEAHPVMEN